MIRLPFASPEKVNSASNSTLLGNALVLLISIALFVLSTLYEPCLESLRIFATPCLSNIKKGVKSIK